MAGIWQKISKIFGKEPDFVDKRHSRNTSSRMLESELEKQARGEEIKPPWIVFENVEPFAGSWRQGAAEHWLNNVWLPFWTNLSVEEKRNYLEKWNPPDDVWNEYVTLRWFSDIKRDEKWLQSEKIKLADKREIEPPWIAFPLSFATFGWDGGFLESWKLGVWIPFWDKLNEEERENYLEKWKPPSRDWTENLMSVWRGEIEKSEKWFEKQKSAAEVERGFYGSEIMMPWEAFPPIQSDKTVWNKNFVGRWKNQVWNIYWRNTPESEFTAEIEQLSPPENWRNYLGLKWDNF